ncbi:uncharacterized protein LOC120358287 [Solenopsis invicta]|uniref:uncharacterized protein LOC120358287 n=1 Tax=Solenopsis invicta TaxID=13686 RepID=UPI00193E8415|nr:uncharacterized protein LOC120358287 [Solenopsis invicta]
MRLFTYKHKNYKYQWNVQTTKLLIEEVRSNFGLLNNKNYMQKNIWKKIANNFKEKGHNITEEQCSVKWKNFKQKYKSVRDLNNQTGRAKESWEYYDLIDDFINNKPEITPTSLASSTHGFRIHQSTLTEESAENNSSVLSTSSDTRCNIRKRRRNDEPSWVKALCEQRRVHHEENIQIQTKFLKLFEKYVEKENRHK